MLRLHTESFTATFHESCFNDKEVVATLLPLVKPLRILVYMILRLNRRHLWPEF